jgi:hypothetical protein
LTREISSLSIAKVYKLSTLDLSNAQRLLTGRIKLSRPLAQLSDVQFRQECRSLFPVSSKKSTKEHVFRSTFSALVRAEKTLRRAMHFSKRMSPNQRRRIFEKVTALSHLIAGWKVVA